MITGKTKLTGILGWPVGHSLSPVMHNAAFSALKIDYSYVPLPVEPDKLKDAVAGLKSMGFIGVNVTIPHKVAVIPYLDELDNSAKVTGAVNTIVIKDSKCIGYNTDAQGFIQSLLAEKIMIKDKNVVIMGAGGAARAVVCGLMNEGSKNILIGTRNSTKAQEFARSIPLPGNIQGCAWNEQIFTNALLQCDILINCTPIGMESNPKIKLPVNWHNIKKSAVICDLIYNPPLTDFLTEAKKHGHLVINGLGMLIEQGALAFELWTEKSAPRQIMRETIKKTSSIYS